ncbi:hypothetical protein, partial [Staphylococcus epidermidis]|uniref:hypothetical protein n=1 Tax=Staphylococcus epidermidis TaxID=1282 RepID=UPI001C92CCC2
MTSPEPNSPGGPRIHETSQERPHLSSLHVREDVAITGLCGNVHVPTGGTCGLAGGDEGACRFIA